MTTSIGLLGKFALAGGLVIAATIVTPSVDVKLGNAPAASGAVAVEDPILFYRDPIAGQELSKTPRKDSMGMDFVPARRSAVLPLLAKLPAAPSPSTEDPLFWRDTMGKAEVSPTPGKDSMGMDMAPVHASDIVGLLAKSNAPDATAKSQGPEPAKKRILYYRNPMGLADVSPIPKKDAMGMDYRPVYEGDDDDSSTLKIAPGKIQRTGVRSEMAEIREIKTRLRAPGTIQLDERRVTIVATRSTAFIEKVAEVTTGEMVKKGQVLFTFYSPEVASAAAQYLSNPGFEGARARLDLLDVPREYIAEIDRMRKVPLSVSWRAPRDGVIFERTAIDGMKADAGQSLFKIVDMSVVWALVDVPDGNFEQVRPGQDVLVRARGVSPDHAYHGRVALIYPQINRETRTARVRVELQNPDLVLRPDMYVDAEILTGAGGDVVTVPDAAVISSGTKSIVLLDKGDGRFEPREVRIGRRGEGLVEIREGVTASDKVVTSANFLIDAESNLKAALKGLGQSEEPK